MTRFDLSLALWQLRGRGSRILLFIACIAIGVAARVSVGSFMAQVDRAVNREARSLLTADLEVSASQPLSATTLSDLALAAGPEARYQDRASLLSVLSGTAGGKRRSRLCQLSAVEGAYPFYGKLRLKLENGGEAQTLEGFDGGQALVYVAPELLPQLDLALGDSVRIGRKDFRIAGTLLEEPGIGGGAFSLGPRVLMPYKLLQETGLSGFGSRVNYARLVALPSAELAAPLAESLRKTWNLKLPGNLAGPPPPDSLRVRTYKDAEDNVKRFFDRLADFLNLASLMALLLGGIGVASVVRGFVREQHAEIGVLRTLGASGARITRVYLVQCVGLGLAGAIFGVIVGTALQNMLPWLLKDFLPVSLSATLDPETWLVGILLGVLTSFLFSLLPVLELAQNAPAQLFRDDLRQSGSSLRFWLLASAGAVLFALIGYFEAHSFARGAGFVGALIAGALLIWALAAPLLLRLARLKPSTLGIRYGLSNLARPGLRPVASVIALGCAALHLGMIATYQYSLVSELDPGKRGGELPSLFLIDVQSDQVEGLKKWLLARGVEKNEFSPMVRARYEGLNGQGADLKTGWSRENEDDRQMRSREQNLSYRDALGSDEEIVKGSWMKAGTSTAEASLEDWFAERLGAKIGDKIDFDVQGVPLEAEITSFRKVHWASFKPNFFILLSPWLLDGAPTTWIASVSGLADGQREDLQTALVGAFPNVTVFDVAATGRKVMGIMEKISWAIRAVALFSLFSGLVVLVGIALSSAGARRQEAALLKTLGAGRGTIYLALATEFGALGFLSGFLGLGLSTAFAWVLLEKILEIPFHLPLGNLLLLLLLMTLICALTGVFSCLPSIRSKPLAVLRED